jgi:oligoendopeptidase F
MQRFYFDKDDPGGAAIPARDQIAVADTWDLAPLYPQTENWHADFAKLEAGFDAVSQFRGRAGESAQTLREVLEFDRTLSLQVERLYHYASLKLAEDGSNAASLAREAQLQNLFTRIGEACAFLTPEIQAIDDATFDRYLSDPALSEWVLSLKKTRRMRAHTLSANEERLLALAGSALSGHDETFSQLTNVDMKFGTIRDEEGNERPLSQSSISSFLLKRDRGLRQRAFKQFYAEFEDHKFTCASTLANSVKADVFRARARNYPSALEAALFPDDVPVAVYDNLIASVHANLQPLFRYFELRKRLLKLDEIHAYDTYVPLVPELETRIEWDEAVAKVLAALKPLGEEYCATLAHGLRDGRWCDRYENKGKRSGAFSSSSYGNPPYIMMNYKADVFADVYTLAHEAGHSMHTWHSQRSQRFQEYGYPIFLAEVASTFNEELLTHHLLEETNDPMMRAYIINRQIDDIRGTVYRQTMFAEFEKLIHAMEEAGEPLTVETFQSTYRGLLKTYFGPDFVLDAELDLECFRIPHFYSAFYVYKYATGISAAVALSEQVLASGDPARYLGFLNSGSSKFPIPTLQEAGVDMSTAAPIEATLSLFARRVEELEQLLG